MTQFSPKLNNSKGFGLIEILLVLAISAVLLISSYRALQSSSSSEMLTSQFEAYIATVKEAANTYFNQNCAAIGNPVLANLTDTQLFQAIGQPMKINNPFKTSSTQITYTWSPPNSPPVRYVSIQIKTTFLNFNTHVLALLPIIAANTGGQLSNSTLSNTITWTFAAGINQTPVGIVGLDPVTQAKITYEKIMLQPIINSGDTNLTICNTFPQQL